MHEVFHNLLANPMFQKKRNRYILLGLLVAIYIAYYLLNLSQYNQMFITEDQSNSGMKNILFSSLTNVLIIITGFIYLIVTITFSLTGKMQYQLKILPFEKGSIWLGSMLFKLVLSYGAFLIVFAIIIPLLKLFYFPWLVSLLVFVYCQLLFFFSILFYHFIFHVLGEKLKLTTYNLNHGLLVVLLFFHLFVFRFKIDQSIQNLNMELNGLIMILLISILLIGVALLLMLIYYSKEEDQTGIYYGEEFFLFRWGKRVNTFTLILLGFLRNKLMFRVLGIALLFFTLALWDTKDFFIAATTFSYVYPLLSFIGIRYFNTTLSYRGMNRFFTITPVKETVITTGISLVLNLPLILFALTLSSDYWDSAYYGLIIFESAVVMSILFPKSKSSVNEFTASILCVVLAVSIYLVAKSFFIFIIVYLLLIMMKYFLLLQSEEKDTIPSWDFSRFNRKNWRSEEKKL